MAKKRYPWKRYWHPRGGAPLLWDGGYLLDPEEHHAFARQLCTFEELENEHPCLVLLGEPGIGKSQALEAERARVEISLTTQGDHPLWLDLRSYGSEERLLRDTFEHPTFEQWRHSEGVLHLVLDSLDECQLQIKHVASLISAQLDKIRESLARLRLRIACRTDSWPTHLETTLRCHWSEEQVAVVELAPLRRKDVRAAAEAEGIARPEEFLERIRRAQAVPLAIRPVTLAFLLSTWKHDYSLTKDRWELYSRGLELLAAETSESRNSAGWKGVLRHAQRLAVASRIAAQVIFCGSGAVFPGQQPAEVTDGDLQLEDLCGGQERVGSDNLSVGQPEIEETLGTSLFAGRGQNRLGLAHQTFAEFLAAKYLLDHELDIRRIRNLLCVSDELGGSVYPQLAEVAAWVACRSEDFLRILLDRDPQVLLRSDLGSRSDEDRARLVQALLERFARAEDREDPRIDMAPYAHLGHPRLEEQLRGFLIRPPTAQLARHAAIEIAQICRVETLGQDLATLALDSSEDLRTRTLSAYAVGSIGSQSAREQLLALLQLSAAEDPEDQLKGAVLSAVWPGLLSATQVFQRITPPRRENLYGFYANFLAHDLVQSLDDTDLPVGLAWAFENCQSSRRARRYRDVIEEIVTRGFEECSDPVIRTALVKTLIPMWQRFRPVEEPARLKRIEVRLEDAQFRRALIEMAIADPASFEEKDGILCQYTPCLVRPEDLAWTLDRLELEADAEKAKQWATLALWTYRMDAPSRADLILEAAERLPLLAEKFSWLRSPMPIDSEQADTGRRHLAEQRRREGARERSRQSQMAVAAELDRLLRMSEQGDASAWWPITTALAADPSTGRRHRETGFDIIDRPGWKNANMVARSRILDAALRYLTSPRSHPQSRLRDIELYGDTFPAVLALLLLAEEYPGTLGQMLSRDSWAFWQPTVLRYTAVLGSKTNILHGAVVMPAAYRGSPDTFLPLVSQLIEEENAGVLPTSSLAWLDVCWDERFSETLRALVNQGHLSSRYLERLLELLIRHEDREAELFARALLQPPLGQFGSVRREHASAAAIALLDAAQDAGWSDVWRYISRSTEAGTQILKAACRTCLHDREAAWTKKLEESALADLHLWLCRHYPKSEDPPEPTDGELHAVSDREEIARFRDRLLSELVSRGTEAAERHVARIVEQRTDLENGKLYILEARKARREKSWAPLTPHELLEFTRRKDARLVRNSDDLLQVVLQALERIQTKLQGKPPAAEDLWNGRRPKDEWQLSDWLKRQLDTELRGTGIVNLREVQITPGERTDLHVTAIVRGHQPETQEAVTLIIEVKGCWESGVRKAMKAQLADRYLSGGECRHGLYVVGWFQCEAWDPEDGRSRKHRRWTHDQTLHELELQAQELSSDGRVVRTVVLDATLPMGAAKKTSPKKRQRRGTPARPDPSLRSG